MVRADVKAKLMAVLGLALFLLVVMPALIYLSLAWVLRGAGLVRRETRRDRVAEAVEVAFLKKSSAKNF